MSNLRTRSWGFVTATLVVITLSLSGCTFNIGCTKVTLFEPRIDSPIQKDTSGCDNGPTPVVPEAPIAMLLPVAAILVGGGITVGRRRSQRRLALSHSAQS